MVNDHNTSNKKKTRKSYGDSKVDLNNHKDFQLKCLNGSPPALQIHRQIRLKKKITMHKNKINISKGPEIEYKCWAVIKAMTLETMEPEIIIIFDSRQKPWVETHGGNSYEMNKQSNKSERNKWIN